MNSGPILALDLATQTGWAVYAAGVYTSGTIGFQNRRFEGGGMRFLKFRRWMLEMVEVQKPQEVVYEEVRRHMGVDAAHIYGGLLSQMQSVLEERGIPYRGIPVGTIKKFATGSGGANKEAMVAAAKARWPDQNIQDDNQADALWILACGMEGNQ